MKFNKFIKKKILVIDDEVRMRIPLKDFLIKEGYQVVEAVNNQISLFYAYGDSLFGNKLLILSGYLESGEILELKIPEIYIDRSVKITYRFMIIYSLILFSIAMTFAYVLSTSFVRLWLLMMN